MAPRKRHDNGNVSAKVLVNASPQTVLQWEAKSGRSWRGMQEESYRKCPGDHQNSIAFYPFFAHETLHPEREVAPITTAQSR